jgi:NAD-dependent dihydropyrimidine dehydrogenase PreA subunit
MMETTMTAGRPLGARRKIIKIDDAKCDGCAECIPNCPEGAIQVIEGKARLVSDLCCDGLGACLGHCPRGAIEIEERDAVPYDERVVMANIVKQGKAVVQAHLEHLRQHGENMFLAQALEFLRASPMQASVDRIHALPALQAPAGCPGSRSMSFRPIPSLSARPVSSAPNPAGKSEDKRPSALHHWPIQLHLLNPRAPHYQEADLLLSADCAPFALGDFHRDFLQGRALAIACPKLDQGQEAYLAKLTAMVDEAQVKSITVIIMEVPCCNGLLNLAQNAVARAQRKVPIHSVIVSLEGEILRDSRV